MTMGNMIAKLRKERGMTQLDLAQKMGVTDKAVSKWERDLSCPDVTTLPKLAEVFGISVDELMQVEQKQPAKTDNKPLIRLICKAVSLAMGVAVIVLSTLGQLDAQSGLGMLAVGLTAMATMQFIPE